MCRLSPKLRRAARSGLETKEQTMDALEGYKIAVDRAQGMSERRQRTTQIYLAVNTAILGVLSLLVQNAGFGGWTFVAVSLPLFVVGAAACLVWQRILTDFRVIISWHYEKLREIEKIVPASYLVCTQEWETFYRPRGGKERFGFSRLEAWLPRLFVGLYAVYFLGLLIAAALGWK